MSRVIALFRFLNRSEWGLRFWVWVFSCGDFLIPVVAIVVLEVLGIFFVFVCAGVWVWNFLLGREGLSCSVKMVKTAGGSGSGSKKSPPKKKAAAKKAPAKKAVAKKAPPVKKVPAKKKPTKADEGSSDPPVPVQTDPIPDSAGKEIVPFNPPEAVIRLQEVLNRSSRQEEPVKEDEGVPATGSATPGLDIPRAQSEESHSLYSDAISTSIHSEGNTPRSGQSAFPPSVTVTAGIAVEKDVIPGVPTPASEDVVPPSVNVEVDTVVEEVVAPGVPTPEDEPVVPPSESPPAVPAPSSTRGPHFTDRFPPGVPRRSSRQTASASASKEKGKKRVRIVDVESDDEVWNSEDDTEIDAGLASEEDTPPPKKQKRVSKGKAHVSPGAARGSSAKRKNIKVRGSVDQSTESPSTPSSI